MAKTNVPVPYTGVLLGEGVGTLLPVADCVIDGVGEAEE